MSSFNVWGVAVQTWKHSSLLVIISCVAAIGGLLFGYDTGVISGAILFIKKDFILSTGLEEFIISVTPLGALIGALIGGRLSDHFGRKKVVLLSSLIFVLSAIGLSTALSPGWIVFWRSIVGFAIGITSATVPLYIAELSPRSIRGALVSFNQLFITIGIFVAYIAGAFFAKTSGWRPMFALASIPAALQFLIMLFFPESPRWLIKKGEKEKALAILCRFRKTKKDAQLEVNHIQERLNHSPGSWRHLFSARIRPALWAGIGLTIIQQVTGINTIIYYAPTIFQFAGFTSATSAIYASLWIGLINMLMTCVAIWLIDKVGRKPLLMIGLSGMVLSLLILGFAFFMQNFLGQSETQVGWISILMLICYIAFFAFSLGPIAWLINSEIYPLYVRGRGVGVATCVNWGANFIVAQTFLNLVHWLSISGAFWLYAILGLFSLYFIKRKIPETKNKSLEEIEEFLKKGQASTL